MDEDEFVFVVCGSVTLVEDRGESLLSAGDCAGFPAGTPDAHHFQNRSATPAVLLEIGSRRAASDTIHYPDIGLILRPGRGVYEQANRSGSPFAKASSSSR
jgi:uncharacterized cupin superfamily protein